MVKRSPVRGNRELGVSDRMPVKSLKKVITAVGVKPSSAEEAALNL